MPRPIWTGTVSFGLVAVPVKLFSATEDHDVHFHPLERGTGERIRYQRVAESSGREVDYEDIVKGYEVTGGEYVVVEPDELEAIDPGPPRTVEVEDFIELDSVDPMYFQKSYYLAPADEGSSRPYRLLHHAMESSGRAAIGRFVMRSKQHLAVVRAAGSGLVLETMFFADEVRDQDDLDEMGFLEKGSPPSDRELKAAEQLIDSLTIGWDPERYRDTYREQVLDLVRRKAEGEEVVTEAKEEPAPVIDLMDALEKSIKRTRGDKGAEPAGRTDGSKPKGKGRSRKSSRKYEAMSKDRLYEEAQRRAISGRSKMSRDQLVTALKKAS